jgi:5-amino-6-(5-phosphoribosylamino)uracil reductase
MVAGADGPRLLAAFAARKDREARAAALAPWTTAIDRHTAAHRPIGNAWSRSVFDGDFYVSPPPSSDLPAASLVFVQSREGNTAARNPSSLGGGETDKHVIYEGLSRVAADAVMAGAETIRDGRIIFSVWHPELVALRAALGLPRHPIQIVATLRGVAVDEGLLFNIPEIRVLLLTLPAVSVAMHHALAQRPWVTPVLMPTADDLRDAFRQLRQMGIGTVSCVGGRTLARQLLAAGLIQDLYLTQSPQSGGEPDTPLSERPLRSELVVRKAGSGPDAGVVFEHLRV